jgi:pilus assembly protein CpaF
MWNIRRGEADKNKEAGTRADAADSFPPENRIAVVSEPDAHTELKVDLHRKILDLINLPMLEELTRPQIEAEVGDLIAEELSTHHQLLNRAERKSITSDVLDELLGLGPLEPLLKDATVTDILVNGPRNVFVERQGLLVRTGARFKDDKHLLRIIQKIVSGVGRRVDESSPMVDARLPDGSRVNAVVPPLAVDGPLLSIRKFAKVPIDISRLVEIGSLSPAMQVVLQALVTAKLNVVISGGTGSGKTTLLNAMSAFIRNHERIVTIEDSAELQLQQEHVGRLETRPPSIEGTGEVTQRDLLKNALRMRPDRIIVGEVRAGEAFDMLQAMNTGHDGSMTTVHANSPRDALRRIEQMIGMSGIELSPASARSQIASAIHIVIQVSRLHDGRRKVMSISEIAGLEGDVIGLQEIFRFRPSGRSDEGIVEGFFEPSGIRPRFYELVTTMGLDLPLELFRPENRVAA